MGKKKRRKRQLQTKNAIKASQPPPEPTKSADTEDEECFRDIVVGVVSLVWYYCLIKLFNFPPIGLNAAGFLHFIIFTQLVFTIHSAWQIVMPSSTSQSAWTNALYIVKKILVMGSLVGFLLGTKGVLAASS